MNQIRRVWCRCHNGKERDDGGRTVYLEGTWIDDVPSFYLSLGEAINGPNGYFGGCLDALDDCLCGGFGVLPPLSIRLSHFDEVRKALNGQAWCRFQAERFREFALEGDGIEDLVDKGYLGDGSEAEVARWTSRYQAALAGEAVVWDEFGSYFDALLAVLKRRRAELVSEVEAR